eukprot:Gb_02707 [translate_table: standard]
MTMAKMQRLLAKWTFHSFPSCSFSTSSSSCPFPLPFCRGRSSSSLLRESKDIQPPLSKKNPLPISVHGKTWYDPYHWMSNLEDPAVSAHLQEENQYTEAVMAATIPLQQLLHTEMQSRMAPEISTPPERWGPWLYYQCVPEGKEYPVLCRRLERRESLAALVLPFVRARYKEERLLPASEASQNWPAICLELASWFMPVLSSNMFFGSPPFRLEKDCSPWAPAYLRHAKASVKLSKHGLSLEILLLKTRLIGYGQRRLYQSKAVLRVFRMLTGTS